MQKVNTGLGSFTAGLVFFDTFSEAIVMQSQNGQSHGLYVWLVVAIVSVTIAATFIVYKYKITRARHAEIIAALNTSS